MLLLSATRYLREVALRAQESLRASTKVVVQPRAPTHIWGYFTRVATRVIDTELPADLARKLSVRNLMQDAPAVLLAPLGVSVDYRGGGLGTFLFRHAILQAMVGAHQIGGAALVVDAVSPEIAAWYRERIPDLRPLTPQDLRLIVPMRTLVDALEPVPEPS
ncbi:MAG: hypothetical protein ACRDHX_13880 [Chloroflexota bacterium]